VPTAGNGGQFVNELSGLAIADEDQFRLAILETELLGREAAERRLTNMWPGDGTGIAAPNPALEEDVLTYRQILDVGPDAVPDERIEAFKANHGYFARVALAYGKPEGAVERAAVLDGGGALLLLLMGACGGMVLLALAGLTCFVIALVRMASGQVSWRFERPMTGGSVGLEMLAVFVSGFVLLKFVSAAVEAAVTPAGGTAPEWMTAAHLGMQWSLIVILLYPLLRGVSFERLSSVVGWTRGRGVLREIGAGLFGYLAGLPLLFVAFVVTVTIMFIIQAVRIQAGLPNEPVSNPILDLVNSASPLAIILLVTLATIWAPIVEETIMRGGFYRHLRGVMGVVLAGVISAIVFGVLHGYAFFLLMPVMTLGFVFAMIREWRGSLIACVTAHAVHNGMVMFLLLTVLSVLKG
jgi:membrane protease YdiL (CAAX protease family)